MSSPAGGCMEWGSRTANILSWKIAGGGHSRLGKGRCGEGTGVAGSPPARSALPRSADGETRGLGGPRRQWQWRRFPSRAPGTPPFPVTCEPERRRLGQAPGHMFPLFHTRLPPAPPFLLSLATLSFSFSLPPPISLVSPPLHQLSMFPDRNQSVICQLLSIRP